MSANPKDWMHWLTIAFTIHNNWVNQTLGTSPSQVLLGYDIALTPLENTASNTQSANDWIKTMMEKCATAIDAINCITRKSIVIPSQHKEGAQVWLEAVNLKIKHQKTKLAPKRYGPFTVEKEISPVAYQLRLPASWGPVYSPCTAATTIQIIDNFDTVTDIARNLIRTLKQCKHEH